MRLNEFRGRGVIDRCLWRFQELRIELAAYKALIVEDSFLKGNGRVDSFHHKHAERSPHPLNRFRPIASIRNEFRNQRIVVGWHDAIGISGRIDTDPDSTRKVESCNTSR